MILVVSIVFSLLLHILNDLGIVSEIAVTLCVINPDIGGDVCAPESNSEQDAIKGKWVRVPRNLNLEGGYMSGWLVRNSHFLSPNEILTCSRKYTIVAQGVKTSILSQKSDFILRKSNLQSHLTTGTKLQRPYELDCGVFHPYIYGIRLARHLVK